MQLSFSWIIQYSLNILGTQKTNSRNLSILFRFCSANNVFILSLLRYGINIIKCLQLVFKDPSAIGPSRFVYNSVTVYKKNFRLGSFYILQQIALNFRTCTTIVILYKQSPCPLPNFLIQITFFGSRIYRDDSTFIIPRVSYDCALLISRK